MNSYNRGPEPWIIYLMCTKLAIYLVQQSPSDFETILTVIWTDEER